MKFNRVYNNQLQPCDRDDFCTEFKKDCKRLTRGQIQLKYKINHTTVIYYEKKLKCHAIKTNKTITAADLIQVKELRAKGYTAIEIGKQLKRSDNSIYQILQKIKKLEAK